MMGLEPSALGQASPCPGPGRDSRTACHVWTHDIHPSSFQSGIASFTSPKGEVSLILYDQTANLYRKQHYPASLTLHYVWWFPAIYPAFKDKGWTFKRSHGFDTWNQGGSRSTVTTPGPRSPAWVGAESHIC